MDCSGKPDCPCEPCENYRIRKAGLIAGGQGRSDEDLENDASNGSVAFVGFVLCIIALVFWSLLLSGCSATNRVYPHGALKKVVGAE